MWRTYLRAASISGNRSMRAPPCAMQVSFTPVLPKTRIGISPAVPLARTAGAPKPRPAKAVPTKLLLFIRISPLEIELGAELQHASDARRGYCPESLGRFPCRVETNG